MDVLPLATGHLDGVGTTVVGPGWIRGRGRVGHGGHPLGAPEKPDKRDSRVLRGETAGEAAVLGDIRPALKDKTVVLEPLKPLASYELSGDTDSPAASFSQRNKEEAHGFIVGAELERLRSILLVEFVGRNVLDELECVLTELFSVPNGDVRCGHGRI